MHGLETIKRLNNEAKTPESVGTVEGIIAKLSTGNVRTVIWTLFDAKDEFLRQYATEVCTLNNSPRYLLTMAVVSEGFSQNACSRAELDFIIDHACIITYRGDHT